MATGTGSRRGPTVGAGNTLLAAAAAHGFAPLVLAELQPRAGGTARPGAHPFTAALCAPTWRTCGRTYTVGTTHPRAFDRHVDRHTGDYGVDRGGGSCLRSEVAAFEARLEAPVAGTNDAATLRSHNTAA